MNNFLRGFIAATAALNVGVHAAAAAPPQLTVKTETGIFSGLLDPEFPNVRLWRNIPYASPPTGSRRFLPPEKLAKSSDKHSSIVFGPSCPQYTSSIPSVWSMYFPMLLPFSPYERVTEGNVFSSAGEDCLSLAVWAPLNATKDDKLPVLLFITGGEYIQGNINTAGQIPANWVSRTQAHLVVSINYRVGIFGFPNAAGLQQNNLGVLDQRMALEWVRDNIESFGGDAQAITIWGQSAGSVSVDILNYAFYDNPIARAAHMESGVVQIGLGYWDTEHTNFTFVAQNLGCDFPGDPHGELDCMRQLPMTEIERFIGQYSDNGTDPYLTFIPVADEKIVFSNYTERANSGLIANIPAMLGITAFEATALWASPLDNLTVGPYLPPVLDETLELFVCPAAESSVLRKENNLLTFRYQFAANFSNISPLSWLGAYHQSDMAFWMGTYPLWPGDIPNAERELATIMQDLFFEFLKDPEHGLINEGWLSYDPTAAGGGTLLRFGAGGVAVANVSGHEVDSVCTGTGQYNPYP